ncbi:MAG: hypothetical protein ABFE07_28285 [Armatimonadia bacterium]
MDMWRDYWKGYHALVLEADNASDYALVGLMTVIMPFAAIVMLPLQLIMIAPGWLIAKIAQRKGEA